MQIFVQLPARARTLTLAVNECDQVWEVKQRFFQAFNLEAHQQNEPKLVCGYRVLEDHKMLHESDVKDCSTLHLHLPLHGGMPKKVVKKKKEKTEGASSASAAAPPEEEEEFPDLDIRPERWINLQVKLTTWDHLNFSILLRTSTRLYTIVEKIKERHGGSVKDISLYKHQVKAENSLPDLGSTLDEVGFEGGTQDNPRTEILEYDYKNLRRLMIRTALCSYLLQEERVAKTLHARSRQRSKTRRGSERRRPQQQSQSPAGANRWKTTQSQTRIEARRKTASSL